MGVVLNDDYHYSSLPGRPLDLPPLGQTGLTDASMNNNNNNNNNNTNLRVCYILIFVNLKEIDIYFLTSSPSYLAFALFPSPYLIYHELTPVSCHPNDKMSLNHSCLKLWSSS